MGALYRAASRRYTGTVGAAGTLRTNPRKSLAGIVSTSGVLLRRASLRFAASPALSGIVALYRFVVTRFVALAGSVANVGALARRTNLVRWGTVTSAGERIGMPRKALSGVITASLAGYVLKVGEVLVRFADRASSFLVVAANSAVIREIRGGAAFLLERAAEIAHDRDGASFLSVVANSAVIREIRSGAAFLLERAAEIGEDRDGSRFQ